MIDRNICNSESPSIISIKNILARIKDQISMRTVTVAIRQYCMQQQQIHKKDQLLSFFLHCESKLKRYSNAQWNRAINNQIRKIVGLQKIDETIVKIVSKSFFRELKKIPSNDQDSQMDTMLSQALGDLKDLEISEDIKMKTKYFFNWCTFIAERRQIKRLKNKEVDDLKRSKVFNQYSLKFQSFIQWKQHVRKTKIQNQKAKIIEANSKNRLLQKVFVQINEKTEVIIIENLLQDAVQERMKQVQLKRVFSKLRSNKKMEESYQYRPQPNENIWVYRFYNFITSKMQPYMNKSSLQSRHIMEQTYQELSLKNCWKHMKSQADYTNLRIKKVKDWIKSVNIKKFIQIKRNTNSIRSKLKQIKLERRIIQYKHFFDVIEEGSKFELSFIEKISVMKAYIKTNTLLTLISNIKRNKQTKMSLKTKLALSQAQTTVSKKSNFFKNICQLASKRKDIQFKSSALVCFYLINTFKNKLKNFKKYKQSASQLKKQLNSRHQKHLSKLTWSCLLQYKCIKASESETLQNLSNIVEIKIKKEIFCKLKERSHNLNRIERLISKSQYVVLKISFITILNRMLSNKIKIKNFYQKQDLGLKRKLFQLLKCNSQILNSNSNKIKKSGIKFAKRRLIINMNRLVGQKMQAEQIQQLQRKHDKKVVFVKLSENKNMIEEEQRKQNEIALLLKSSGMLRFMNNCNYKMDYRELEENKTFKINKLIIRNYIRSMKKLNRNRKQQSVINLQKNLLNQEKVKQIRQSMSTICLLKLLRQKQSTIIRKGALLMNKQYNSFLQFMKFNYQSAILKKMLKAKQLSQLTKLVQIRSDLTYKIEALVNTRIKMQAKKAVNTLQNNYYDAIEERQTKMNYLSDLIINKRQTSSKRVLINRLQQHQQLKQNSMILTNCIIKQNVGYLVRSYLSGKSESIKDLVALRHYALNIKKRCFRQLKQAMTVIVLKENRARTEHHSKLSMQKSMDHARRKSKLLQTIERYNMSRISRVVR